MFNAEANKEYEFEIAFVGSTGGGAAGLLFFGFIGALAGSSIDATYTLTLKKTSDIEVSHGKTVTEQRVLPQQTSDEGRQPSQQPTEQAKAATASQNQPAPVEASVKSVPLPPAVAPAVPASAPSAQNQPTKPPNTESATARKLRELNELRKEGLITESEYNEKRKAILSAM